MRTQILAFKVFTLIITSLPGCSQPANPPSAPDTSTSGVPAQVPRTAKGVVRSGAVTHYNRGVDLEQQGDIAGAIQAYNETIKADPKFKNAYFNRGNARSAQGDHAGALADFTEVLRIDPEDAPAYVNRGIERQELDDLDGAIADMSEAIKKDSRLAQAFASRSVANLCAGKDQEATQDYEHTLQLNSELKGTLDLDMARAFGRRAIARLREGKDAEAQHDIEQAIRLDPSLKSGLESLSAKVKEERNRKSERSK